MVNADPNTVAFEWQFNNSGESVELPRPLAASLEDGTSSTLDYSPTSDRDYGTLACWGRNAVGRQAEPCVFQVVPAVRPGPLRNCTLRPAANQTADDEDAPAVVVECAAGHDGGLPQQFALEAYESRTMRLRLNTTAARQPLFRLQLEDLLPAHTPALHLVLYAVNQKGRGELTVLEGITLGDTEKRTESMSGSGDEGIGMVPLAAMLTGVILTTGLSVLLVAVLAVRRRRFRHERAKEEAEDAAAAAAAKHKPPTCGEPPRRGARAVLVSFSQRGDGDQRYVTSYVAKPAGECGLEPDILNPSRGVNVFCRQTISPQENLLKHDDQKQNFPENTYGQIAR